MYVYFFYNWGYAYANKATAINQNLTPEGGAEVSRVRMGDVYRPMSLSIVHTTVQDNKEHSLLRLRIRRSNNLEQST